MRGIAEQRNAPRAPGRQRILIDHRVLEHQLRRAQERRNVEPVEAPAFGAADEILHPRGTVPVPALVLRRLDLPQPVHELPAFGVDAVADRVVNELAGREPAGARHARAGQDRLPARHAAPHVDPAVARLAFIGVELPADHGVNAVAAYGRLSLDRVAVAEEQLYRLPGLFKTQAMPTEMNALLVDALFNRGEQHRLQIGAMDRELRPPIPRSATERLPVDQLAESVEKHALLGLDRYCGQRRLQPE